MASKKSKMKSTTAVKEAKRIIHASTKPKHGEIHPALVINCGEFSHGACWI